ncbi:hypothetical protein [Rhodococcus wratislaviensis]|uniref:hypothetical protein n=1 Tax=Rhodococcus wratislaviensis TaxID=44752 RepID=UPI003518D171
MAELREHVLLHHPISRPALLHRGRLCGDARLLVQRATTPAEWVTTNCTWARLNGVEIPIADFAAQLSGLRGVVDVLLGNDRSERRFEFDFSISTVEDLEGVDAALVHLIEGGDITSSSISRFFERAQTFSSARNYAGGIADYLYWLAARGITSDPETDARNRDKLNRAADLLRDIDRSAAYAITSLISFHFNHFGDAEQRALSPRLRAVSARLREMLGATPRQTERSGIDGDLAHIERLLMDDRTASLVSLCSLPLDRATTDQVAGFGTVALDSYDRFKAVLFISEHHLVTGDPRASQLVRTAVQNGLPEHWVNTRLDLITNEGPIWHTAAATTAPAKERAAVPQTGTRTPRPAASRRSTIAGRTSRSAKPPTNPTSASTPQRTATTAAPKPGTPRAPRTAPIDPIAPAAAARTGSVTTPPVAAAAGTNPAGRGAGAPTPIRAGSSTSSTGSRADGTAVVARAGRQVSPTNPANTTPPVSDTPPWETASTLETQNDVSRETTEGTEPHRRSWWTRLLPWWK